MRTVYGEQGDAVMSTLVTWEHTKTGHTIHNLNNHLARNPDVLEGINVHSLQWWIENLKGNSDKEWHQGKMKLLSQLPGQPPRYCCLGVLCEISAVGRWEAIPMNDNTFGFRYLCKSSSAGACPPFEVWKKYIGIPKEAGDMIAEVCISLNDKEGYNFEQIGKWLENNILRPAMEAQGVRQT